MNNPKNDLQQRVIWSKISGDVENALEKISARVEKRSETGMKFRSNGGLFVVKIERVKDQ